MKPAPRSRPLPPATVRERALAALPGEFGFVDLASFIRGFRTAIRRQRSTAKATSRPGGTRVIRFRVAQLLVRGRSPMEIALELGFSLRFIGRVLAGLKHPEKIMNPKTLKELERAKARLARLEALVAAEKRKELASLPAQYGFPNSSAFIRAVKAAVVQMSPKRRYTRVTDSVRKRIKQLVKAGKSAPEIGRKLGISMASVHNAKKSLGLVHPHRRSR